MTKLRPPLSIDAAIARVIGQLPNGYDSAAQVTGKNAGTIRAWGDPDRREQISVDCAIALDLAHQEHGGVGAPIFEAYAAKLEMAEAGRFADRHQLLAHTERLIREGGEAHAALVRACQPGATASEVADAMRELGEAHDVFIPVLALLDGLAKAPRPYAGEAQPP